MPKITFLVDHTPQGQAPDRPTYKAGESYELDLSYAEKYKRRGLAVDYVAPAPAPPVAVAPPEPEPEKVEQEEAAVQNQEPPRRDTDGTHHFRGKRR